MIVIQLFEQLVGIFAHAAYQIVAPLKRVEDKVIHQAEALDVTGVGHMDTGTVAADNLIADADVLMVCAKDFVDKCTEVMVNRDINAAGMDGELMLAWWEDMDKL